MPRTFLCGIVAVLLLSDGWIGSTAAADQKFAFYHENVLGTSLELQVRAETAEAARSAEAVVLAEIDRLGKILSGYDPTSEFSRWQAKASKPVRVSDELLDVLEACSRWRAASGDAFNPAVETLSRLWTARAREGRMPAAVELAAACVRARDASWPLDRASRTAQPAGDCPLSLNALAKGYIVDRACDAAMQARLDIRGLLVNVGGDLRVCGDMAVRVGIADPWHDSLATQPVARIELRDAAMATSGNYQRGFSVNGRWFSHVIDPRTGRPAGQIVSASVVAKCAADADALATICCVLPVEESLALVKGLPGAECMIVEQDGRVVKSDGWRRRDLPPPSLVAFAGEKVTDTPERSGDGGRRADAASVWNRDFEMEVKFEINSPEGVRRYLRPYIAVWVEDNSGLPVRTLVLFVWKTGPGPQWIPDLRRWYRADQLRRLADETDLVDTMSRATHPPGKYKTVWDGKDDHGKLVEAGEYTVFIEAAREHGTYQILSKKITLGNEAFHEELKGNVEIKSVSIDYRRKKSAR